MAPQLIVGSIFSLTLFADGVLAEGFVFAGLNFRTTAQDLKTRYPSSLVSGDHVWLSKADSHDHIYSVSLPGANPHGRLRIAFERPWNQQSSAADSQYPTCQSILSIVQANYGSPHKVEEFAEERSWHRRFTWAKAVEVLTLECFRMGQEPFLTEAITIVGSDK